MTPTQEQIEAVAQSLAKFDRMFWPDFDAEEKALYRAEAIAAIAAARPFIRAQALEEAAKAFDARPHDLYSGERVAHEIRALKDV